MPETSENETDTRNKASSYQSRSLPTEEEHERRVEDTCSPFFRVLGTEYPRFFRLAFLSFSIAFTYSSLRDGKDAIVMFRMLPASIPFLKSFVVTFFTILFGVFFQFLMSKGVPMRKIMLYANGLFCVYFLLYALVISPNADLLDPYKFLVIDMFGDAKMHVVNLEFLKGLFFLYNFWTSSLFYLSAEMWGSIVLSLLFFGCVNEICPLRQALRFYPLFLISANLALALSGVLGISIGYFFKDNISQITKFYQVFFVGIALLCLANIVVYRQLMDSVVPFPIYITSENAPKKSRAKVGMLDGIIAAFSNPAILCMSICVLSYGMVTNLTEGAYNSSIQKAASSTGKPTLTDTLLAKGTQQIIIGLCTIGFLISPLKSFIQQRGWLSLGMLSPVLSFVGSVLFFVCVWVNVQSESKRASFMIDAGKSISRLTGLSTEARIKVEKYVGLISTSLIKILKYAAFDICKEAIGVKIPKEHRSRFKGIYDGVFGKLGKSAASLLQIILMFLFNTSDVRESVYATLTGVILVTSIWSRASLYLGREYNRAVKERRDLRVVVSAK